jgi:hypothetical protein
MYVYVSSSSLDFMVHYKIQRKFSEHANQGRSVNTHLRRGKPKNPGAKPLVRKAFGVGKIAISGFYRFDCPVRPSCGCASAGEFGVGCTVLRIF